ncbi:hypothetical protein S7711_08908 [Stachybotrys chartarum IBT 7711]|uniref:Uncharacterized protein n=1 Tax=Stachybotrys chartarum (strain CBS 109288 / IBT 7711) TaxID=1280523 RepID=A0A084B1U9_STACB|nr:hypothetical protein S7711_08908 [Stachybotrys chartarum IBT 7711]
MGQQYSQPQPGKKFQVIGAGLPRSGTASFGRALEILLDGPVYHGGTQTTLGPEHEIKTWIRILKQWPARNEAASRVNLDLIKSRTQGFVAITDSPGCTVVSELMMLYPEAKVICTIRDIEAWEHSMSVVSSQSTQWFLRFVLFPVPSLRYFVDYIDALREQWLSLFGEAEPVTRKSYNQHIKWLRDNVPGDRLTFLDSNGQPYEVVAPDNRYVFVSSPKHIKELDHAPDTALSLQAASKQPMYTMQAFNWFDRRGTEGVGFIRALRTLLTNNLPQILPTLGSIIRIRFQEMHENHRVMQGTKHSPVYPMIVKLVVLSNAVSFFGEGLTKNGQFMESALEYIEQTLMCAEVIRLVPKWLALLKAQEVICNTLVPIAKQRCLEREMKKLDQDVPHHADCIQWIMETSPAHNPWSAKRVVHELMAIWFGSVNAVSTTITFAIHDICLHPEYNEPLLEELREGYHIFERPGLGLPLLDSFIKESARLTPVEAQSTRRAALRAFTFSDGTKVEVGDWACTPVRAIMQNPDFSPDPLAFNGFRFASSDALKHTNG